MVARYLDAVKPSAERAVTHEGGSAFVVDKWTRLRRWLILGSESPTYYVGERDLTVEHVGIVRECLADDGVRTVEEIAVVSHEGRAPKHEPALLALALATLHTAGEVRDVAFTNLPAVARTGTHLLHFAAYRQALGGGWGRGMRRAVGRWFNTKTPHDLAYQAVKYKQRDGWALADLLRLAHPKPASGDHDLIAKYIVDGDYPDADDRADWRLLLNAEWFLRKDVSVERKAAMVAAARLPREAIPSELLNEPAIWDALLADMPVGAMVRNLGKMTAVGLLVPGSAAERTVRERLADAERIKQARLHPIALLAALRVYERGRGDKGTLTWAPTKAIVTALDDAFYGAFRHVAPTGKRIVVAVDTSGSMTHATVNGMPYLAAREAAAAMALVTLATEPNAGVVGFTDRAYDLPIRGTMRLDEVLRVVAAAPTGGTDCAAPIRVAIGMGWMVDAFVILTDSETGPGYFCRRDTPEWALVDYRRASGILARSAVVAMAANGISSAGPTDPLQMNCVGLDASLPEVLGLFIRGDL